MVILVMERVPASLRGELSRWMLEVRAGVFIGTLSGMVRDKLWEKACETAKAGAVTLIHNADTEQGFAIRSHGDPDRQLVDHEGLMLFRRPRPASAADVTPEPAAEPEPSSE